MRGVAADTVHCVRACVRAWRPTHLSRLIRREARMCVYSYSRVRRALRDLMLLLNLAHYLLFNPMPPLNLKLLFYPILLAT